MDILQSIIAERRLDVEVAKRTISLETLTQQAAGRTHHSLVEKLVSCETSIIAEMKKASPSAGLLMKDYRPADIAGIYQQNGAAGISVLTEPHHFKGGERDLRVVRHSVDLPILRKDFIFDIYQIYEAAAWGADVVLLIVAALDSELLRVLYDKAIECGLDVLVEAHTAAEVDVVLGLERAIVGVNSRNLRTLKTDLSTACELAVHIPADRMSIAESGIKERCDVIELQDAGYNGFLIGEALMGSEDIGAKLCSFLHD
ncbi:MAG: indole-3-glycerol phosphate synthase TrpC [Kiritimatiellae bacterium]|nr:indole-3-glycerol phosphate synthase TrpC [Kiritimatiellia bacterium]